MDPINAYLLGRIRQQEILESCQRNQQSYVEHPLADGLRQRVGTLVSAMQARAERPRAPQVVEPGESFATSR